jgi:hypothetical protein
MTSPPGPKELANRANADAKRKRKLIPYAGKPKGEAVAYSLKPKPRRSRSKIRKIA